MPDLTGYQLAGLLYAAALIPACIVWAFCGWGARRDQTGIERTTRAGS